MGNLVNRLGNDIVKEIDKLIDKGERARSISNYLKKHHSKTLTEIPSESTIQVYIKKYLADKTLKEGPKAKPLAVIKEQQKAIQGEIVKGNKSLNLNDIGGIFEYSVNEVQLTIEFLKKIREGGGASWQDMGVLLQGCRQLKEIAESLAESADKFRSKDTAEQEQINQRCNCIANAAIQAVRTTFGDDQELVEVFMKKFADYVKLGSGE